MSKKTILIYIDVMERYRFFRRFFAPLKELGYESVIVTGRLSIYLLARYETIECCLLKNIKESSDDNSIDLQNSLSVLNNYHTLNEAYHISNSVLFQLDLLFDKYMVEKVFIWNGTTTIAKTLSFYAKKRAVKVCFFEISNLGAKLFVDRVGTNAQSSLANDLSILEQTFVSDEDFERWKNRWRQESGTPKQTKNSTALPLSFVIDWVGFTFFNALREDRRDAFKVLLEKFRLKKGKSALSTPKDLDLPEKYIFFPMQVSNDSQILLNSDYNNLDALNVAEEIAKESDSVLVVKLHPAEVDHHFIREIEDMSKSGRFLLVDKSTKELISKAQKVVVINSTVGLEAMIEGKDVVVLGRALYKNFKKDHLKRYILDFLIDIDYFSNKPILVSEIKKVLDCHEK